MRFIIFIFFLSNCTCNWHIKRAKIKCGYSFKSDTVYKTLKDSIPGVNASGVKSANVNIDSLQAIILELFAAADNLQTKNDSLLIQALNKRLSNYIIHRTCLNDTLTIAVNGGFVKLWQTGGKFYWNVKIPPQVIERKVPVVVNTTDVKEVWPWWPLLIIIIAVLIVSFLAKKWPAH